MSSRAKSHVLWLINASDGRLCQLNTQLVNDSFCNISLMILLLLLFLFIVDATLSVV